jgi:putative ABC transport system permease protein
MKFTPLILKHLRKNWIRTLSTVLALSVCIFLFCTLQTVVEAVNFGLHAGNAGRLITRHYVSLVFNLPVNYEQRVASVPGVKEVAAFAWFGGIYRDPKNFFANFATEPQKFLDLYPEIMLPPDQKEKWLHDRRGCIVGRKLAQRFGWKLGDTFQLESSIPPYRVGHPFDFVVDGIYDTDEAKYPATDLNSMYFDYKYLYEATSQRIGIGYLAEAIDDPKHAGAISKAIDAEFENSDTPTKTETEQAFMAGFVAMAGNLAFLSNGIGLATLILSEALLIGVVGGLVGILISVAILRILPQVPMIGDILAGYPNFGLSPQTTAIGVGIALLLGLMAGFFPAMTGYRARITETLRQV